MDEMSSEQVEVFQLLSAHLSCLFQKNIRRLEFWEGNRLKSSHITSLLQTCRGYTRSLRKLMQLSARCLTDNVPIAPLLNADA